MRSARIISLALLVLFCTLSALAAPTAILVDTSRSVPPAQFEALKGQIEGLLPDLLSRGPVALYAFNDAPLKLVDFSTDASALGAGVGQLAQGGQYTLLYDCLFAAEKDLAAKGGPGVILLFTDGRDENSAVTLEDFSTRASQAHVAVVTAGMGAIDEKTLRRIAVLTGGQYAGLTSAGAPGALPKLLADTAASLPAPPPPPQGGEARAAASRPGGPRTRTRRRKPLSRPRADGARTGPAGPHRRGRGPAPQAHQDPGGARLRPVRTAPQHVGSGVPRVHGHLPLAAQGRGAG